MFAQLVRTQSDNLTLPFSTFSTHSQKLCTSSLSQFEKMAFRSLGVAVFSTWSALKFDLNRFILLTLRSLDDRRAFVGKHVCPKSQKVIRVLREVKDKVPVWSLCRLQIRLI